MNITPPKLAPLPLSEQHQISIKKSKAMERLVDNFLQQNFKVSHQFPAYNLDASSDSLQNSKAFFQSQVNMLMTMIEHMKRLYSEKQSENVELKKMIDDYDKKLKTENSKNEAKQTINKSKEIQLKSFLKGQSQIKTRKKTEIEDHDIFKAAQSAISQFQSRNFPNRRFIGEKLEGSNLRPRFQLNQAHYFIQEQGQKLHTKNRSLEQILDEVKISKDLNKKMRQELKQVFRQKQKISIDYRMFTVKFQNMEKQYLELEDKHGKTVTQYEIKIQNLRDLLRGIRQNSSPRKLSEKDKEGYYSINRPLNRNQSQESFGSSNISHQSLNLSHIEVNLKQENEYLRNQLIRALDQKGSLRIKLNKLQKTLQKHEKNAQQQKRSGESNGSDQNSLNLSNVQEQIRPNKLSSNAHSFKKNKNTSILVVQNTQKKQKQMLQQKKIFKLLNQVVSIISSMTQNLTPKQINSKYLKSQFLQILVNKLKAYAQQKIKNLDNLNQLQKENFRLKKQKQEFQQKSKKDIDQVKSFLRQITQNSSQVKSSDSTDKAFKNIELNNIQKSQIKDNHQNFTSMNQDYSQRIFQQKEKEYVAKIQNLQRQIEALKNNHFSRQEISESLYRLTNQSQSKSQLNLNNNLNYQIVPTHNAQQDNRCLLQITYFEFFKQKLTEFYQHTIEQLDQWENTALKIATSPKKNHKIKNQAKEQYFSPSVKIIQRNILKVSQQFKSIKESSFDSQCTPINKNEGQEFFKDQKMSRSFISNEQCLENLINKRLQEFQKFSSALLTQYIPEDQQLRRSQIGNEEYSQKFETNEKTKVVRMDSVKTDRPSVDKREFSMQDIDARSQSVSSLQLMRQRQLFIREKISYYVQKSDRQGYLMDSANSKKSYESFQILSPLSKNE